MKILVRDGEDPLLVHAVVRSKETGDKLITYDSLKVTKDFFGESFRTRLTSLSGALNIIDLANVYSCSFIATDDVGKIFSDCNFEVLGRIDGSDLRGCSLMVL